jgi:polyvinyl alcohol dehydrogenase (cytochrome)
MRIKSAAFIGLALAAAPAALAEPNVAEGKALYDARCAMCHASGMGGAPLMDKLASLEPTAVVEKLTTGTMAPMAGGISPENLRNIAVFLTKKPLPAKDGLPAVNP